MKSLFWKSVFPLFCILLIEAMSFGMVIPVLGPMVLDHSSQFLPSDTSLSVRTLIYSLSLGLPMAFMFVGAPLLGDLSDQLGRKRVLLISMLGVTASCLMSAWGVVVGSVFLLLLGRGILGFVDSSESVAKAAMADISCSPKQKIANMSLASIAGTAGFVLGPVIGGFIAENKWHSYLAPFLFAGALAFLNAIFLQCMFTETYQPKAKKKIHLLASFHNLISAFLDKRIQLLAVIFFCMQFAWGTYFQSIAILLVKAFGYEPQKIGAFLSYLGCCFIVTLSVVVRLVLEYLASRQIVILGLILVAVGETIVTFFHQEIAVWLSVIPITMGVGLSYNTILSLFSDAVDQDSQGRVMGVAVALFSSAWVISSVLGGLLSAVNLYLPYGVTAVIAIIGCGLAVRFKEKQE